MVNQFSSLLLNLTYTGDSLLVAPGFAARALTNSLSVMHNILFPTTMSASQKYKQCQAYLEIVRAAGLDEAFYFEDARITYDLDTDSNFDNFKTTGLDLPGLMQSLTQASSYINAMLACPKTVDTTKYDNLWLYHKNPVYRIGGLLVAYVIRLT